MRRSHHGLRAPTHPDPGIERARFRRQVVPGETLELEVTLERMSARAGKGHGTAHVEGQKACETDLLFVIVESEAN